MGQREAMTSCEASSTEHSGWDRTGILPGNPSDLRALFPESAALFSYVVHPLLALTTVSRQLLCQGSRQFECNRDSGRKVDYGKW